MIKPGIIAAAAGSSQSGKTAWVKHKLARHARSLTWDIEGQYPGQVVKSKKELIKLVRKIGGGPGVIAYRPRDFADFDFFCDVAYAWGLLGEKAGKPTAVCVEETSDVTSPGKAPLPWGMLLRRGKKRGISIYAITQRLAESDKTAIGNADYIHCCRLVLASDRKYMAEMLDVPLDQVKNLRSDQGKKVFDYIQRDLGNGNTVAGKLNYKIKNNPKFSKLYH